MSQKRTGVYRIREFGTLAGVTVRALHHYDRLGLLKPSGRSTSGYRLYRDEAALGEDPAGPKAQALAARWRTLVEGFTGGDPEISAGG